MRFNSSITALLAVSVILAPAAGAEPTEVGTTAAANTDTTGTPPRMATRDLFIGTNVFFEERIETSESGQAQLLFLDESALTIASNSDVVLDKFIYDPKTSKGELALSVGAGLFRFVGGRISKTSMVRIKTPTATIGIRGGIAIIKVEPRTNATRAIFMFGKEMTVTNDSGVTRKVTRPSFAVDVASKGKEPSSPRKVSGDEMAGYLNELEGRTGQTAGLTGILTDEQVACCPPVDPGEIIGDPTAAAGDDFKKWFTGPEPMWFTGPEPTCPASLSLACPPILEKYTNFSLNLGDGGNGGKGDGKGGGCCFKAEGSGGEKGGGPTTGGK